MERSTAYWPMPVSPDQVAVAHAPGCAPSRCAQGALRAGPHRHEHVRCRHRELSAPTACVQRAEGVSSSQLPCGRMAGASAHPHARRSQLRRKVLLQLPHPLLHHAEHALPRSISPTSWIDTSVGDAWHPRYEAQGGGFSVVVARSAAGQELIGEMQEAGVLHLEDADLLSALAMHGTCSISRSALLYPHGLGGAACLCRITAIVPRPSPSQGTGEGRSLRSLRSAARSGALLSGVDPDPGRPGLQIRCARRGRRRPPSAKDCSTCSSSPPPKAANPCPTILTSPY